MHTPLLPEVSHQFQESIRSWTETGNNAETPGNRRDLHLLAVSLASWLNHDLQIHPPECRAIIAEFMHCPDTFDEWQSVEKFRTRKIVPHTVGTIDRKHITKNGPEKTGSDYYNYKGFFFLVLLALVVKYRIQIPVDRLWVKWFLLRCTDFQ